MLNPAEEASSRRQCMDAHELTTSLGKFARHLADLGHTPLTVAGYSDGVRHFGEWLHRIGSARHRLTMISLPGSRAIGADALEYANIAVFPPNT